MKQTYYRFFGGLPEVQARWLNKMARQGLRLAAVEGLCYTFVPCQPGEVEYAVDLIAHQGPEEARDYHDFLEEMGYTVFYQAANANLSLGKVRWRPWAQPGGRIAAGGGAYGRELLIVERTRGEAPLSLHTSWEDRAQYYRRLRTPWLSITLLLALCALLSRSWAFGLLTLLALLPTAVYQGKAWQMQKRAQTEEW